MSVPRGRSTSRWLSALLPAVVIVCSWNNSALAGDAADRAPPDGGVIVASPALNAGALDGESGGASLSPPADYAAEPSSHQMAIILWDELKRVRSPSGPANNSGISMVNGRIQ